MYFGAGKLYNRWVENLEENNLEKDEVVKTESNLIEIDDKSLETVKDAVESGNEIAAIRTLISFPCQKSLAELINIYENWSNKEERDAIFATYVSPHLKEPTTITAWCEALGIDRGVPTPFNFYLADKLDGILNFKFIEEVPKFEITVDVDHETSSPDQDIFEKIQEIEKRLDIVGSGNDDNGEYIGKYSLDKGLAENFIGEFLRENTKMTLSEAQIERGIEEMLGEPDESGIYCINIYKFEDDLIKKFATELYEEFFKFIESKDGNVEVEISNELAYVLAEPEDSFENLPCELQAFF